MSEKDQLLEWIYGSLDNLEKRIENIDAKIDRFEGKCTDLSVQATSNKTEIKNIKAVGTFVGSIITVVFGGLISWLGLR